MNQFDADIAVIGGGPAGAIIALRLSQIGYKVTVFEASTYPRHHVGESLHGNVLPLFDVLGLRTEVENAGFIRTAGAVVHWAGKTQFRLNTTGGFQLDRSKFDEMLLSYANRNGVKLQQPCKVVGIHHQARGDWVLQLAQRNSSQRLRCRFVVDATGRRELLPGLRHKIQPSTMALYGYWKNLQLERELTFIDAGPSQWYWMATIPNSGTNCMVFTDSTALNRRHTTNLKDAYLDLVSQSMFASKILAGSLNSEVRTCKSSASAAIEPIGDDWLKVGEAALALDPLSAQGVHHAMASALQGAAAVNSLLQNPDCKIARQFFRDQIREAAAQHRQSTGRFYREQALIYPTSFWIDRACRDDSTPNKITDGLPLNIPLTINPLADWKPTAVIRDEMIVSELALHVPGKRPVCWLDGISLREFLSDVDGTRTGADLINCWRRLRSSDRVLRILNSLWQQDTLVAVDRTCQSAVSSRTDTLPSESNDKLHSRFPSLVKETRQQSAIGDHELLNTSHREFQYRD